MRSPRWTLALRLLICALPLCLLACMAPRAKQGAAPPADYGGYEDGNYGGPVGGSVAMDAPAEAPMAEREESVTIATQSRGRSRFSRQKNKRAEKAPAPATSKDARAKPKDAQAEPLDVEAPEPLDVEAPSKKRQVIYTATMQVSVYDLPHALEVAEGLPDRYGGWLHQRVDNQLVLRIPAEQLDAAIETIAELGVVDYRELQALDVTAEYTDLESRIRVLENMQTQLQALLDKAASVEQALEIRRALDEVTLELEALRAQMRELASSIAFSTLILRLVERGPGEELPSSNDPFTWVDELGAEATGFR